MLALVPLLAGRCGSDAPTPTRLVIGLPASASTLDPYLHDEENTAEVLEHFYDSLVAFGPDLELVPQLALNWQNPTETLWRIRLRSGVVFHDGRPFGAEDVAASILRARTLPGSRIAYHLEGVVQVRTPDPSTVEIVTAYPSPVLLNRLAFVAIVPRNSPGTPITKPVGTGPYRFVSGEPGGTIEGERFDASWWPRPAWKSVRFVPFPDAAGRAEAVPSHAADIVSRFPLDRIEQAAGRRDLRLVPTRGLGVALLGFSLRPGTPFEDLRVRRAVAAAVDRPHLLPVALRPYALPIDQFVPVGVFGYRPGRTPPRPDLARARALFAEAGYPEGFPARLVCADALADVGRSLAAQLGAAGIRVEPEVVPQSELSRRFQSADAPRLFLMSWVAGTGDALELLEALFHTPGGGLGSANRFAYSRPEFDALVHRAARTLEPAARRDALWEAFRLLSEDVPAVPLLVRSNLYAVRPELEWVQRRNRRIRATDIVPSPGAAPRE